MNSLVLVTGGTGFIGRRLTSALLRQGTKVRVASRKPSTTVSTVYADLTDPRSLESACEGVTTVVHCAGYAHARDDGRGAFAAAHRAVNFEGTRDLVHAAGRAGVSRFLFLSSAKAIADPGRLCVDEEHPGEPSSIYGRAKRAAEAEVREGCSRYGMAKVILRPAMVYGAGDRGNLRKLVQGIRGGWFPALPETGNRRSLVHVDDLVDAILTCLRSPNAVGKTYIVASRHAPSGAELCDEIRAMLGKKPARWRIPARLLIAGGFAGDVLGKLTGAPLPLSSETVARLLESEWYSPEHIANDLGWEAKVSLQLGLRDYLSSPEAEFAQS